MENRTPRIGIDLDGVCYDFIGAFRDYLIKQHGRKAVDLPDAVGWSFYKDQWGLTSEEYKTIISQGVKDLEIFWRGAPLPGAVDGMKQLYHEGYELVIITARDFPDVGNFSRYATEYWLSHVGIPYHELHLTHNKTDIDVDLLVDDSPGNLQAYTDMKMRCVAFHQAWNEHCVDYDRVTGWAEVLDFIHKNFPLQVVATATAG